METSQLELSGKRYRIRSIPAYYAQKFLSSDPFDNRDFTESEVLYLMAYVDIRIEGKYLPLDDAQTVDSWVEDWEDLDRLVMAVYELNFGFMRGWRMWRVPSVDNFVGSDPRQLSPFVHALITNKYATLLELKTSCSLRDAFEMQDSLLTKAMNEYRYSQLKGVR